MSGSALATSVEVRERLVEALRLDLVGPGADGPCADECLPGWVRPSTWYLTGFLIPVGTPESVPGYLAALAATVVAAAAAAHVAALRSRRITATA